MDVQRINDTDSVSRTKSSTSSWSYGHRKL